ncbi:hypothetical protein TRFO_25624 [Tritrichomonas foetus]|uniref:von Willebrand factor type A domain containing protein n=1 Tax=Tritrichomonas foetus TaxID=1144522 RepID=A0A1J4K4C2_9EUKA|nr:hypothetical protein TRFO_25624 [Tritrichomonas foetus]|eukprot:OHT06297.1 hypothetical protein TRFO_25624 [Tritrichomonas foetus]
MVFGSVVFINSEKHREIPKHTYAKYEGHQCGFLSSFTFEQVFENVSTKECEYRFVYPSESKVCIYKIVFSIDEQENELKLHDLKQATEINQNMISSGYNLNLSETLPSGYNESIIGDLKPGQILKVSQYFSVKSQTVNSKTISTTVPLDIANPHGRSYPIPRFDFVMYINNLKINDIDTISSNFENGIFTKNKDKDSKYELKSYFQICSNEKDHSDNTVDEIEENHSTMITINTVYSHDLTSLAFKSKNILTLSIIPPLEIHETLDNEYIIMIDCSGSMSGSPINKAKEALEVFIRSLPVSCTFNVIRFGSTFEFLFETPLQYTEETVNKALKLARTLKADLGGTELLSPLQFIVKNQRRSRQIFIVTDGDVDDNDVILKLIRNNDDNRVFSIGMGRSADPVLVEGLATVSGGLSDFVFGNDSLAEKIINMLTYSISARLSNLRILVNGKEIQITPKSTTHLISQKVQTIYSINEDNNNTINITDNCDINSSSIIIIEGIYMNESINFSIENILIDDEECYLKTESIYALCADDLIREIESDIHSSLHPTDILINQCKEISLKSGIPSEYTSYTGFVQGKSCKKEHIRRKSSLGFGFDEINTSSSRGSILRDADNLNHNQNIKLEFTYSSDKLDIGSNLMDDDDNMSYSNNCPHIIDSNDSDSTTKESNHEKKKSGFSHFFSNIFKKKNKKGTKINDNDVTELNDLQPEINTDNHITLNEKRTITIENDEFEIIRPHEPRFGEFDFMNLLSNQHFTGYFHNIEFILKMAGKTQDIELQTIMQSHKLDNNKISTVLSISLIRKNLPEKQGVWYMIEEKALKWLTEQNISEVDKIFLDIQHFLK